MAKRKSSVSKKQATLNRSIFNDLLRLSGESDSEDFSNDIYTLEEEFEASRPQQKSKPREKLKPKTWNRRKIVNPKNQTSYYATKYLLKANTGFTNDPVVIEKKLSSMKKSIEALVKKHFKVGDGLALGYEFTFKFDKTVYDKNLITQAGYADRIIVGKNLNIQGPLDLIIEQLTKRFKDYMSRSNCLGVNLANIILEKTVKPKEDKKTKRTKRIVKKTKTKPKGKKAGRK